MTLLLDTLIILIKPIIFMYSIFDGRKAECVESMVFDAKGQAKEGGMQVLQQCYFMPQG